MSNFRFKTKANFSNINLYIQSQKYGYFLNFVNPIHLNKSSLLLKSISTKSMINGNKHLSWTSQYYSWSCKYFWLKTSNPLTNNHPQTSSDKLSIIYRFTATTFHYFCKFLHPNTTYKSAKQNVTYHYCSPICKDLGQKFKLYSGGIQYSRQ